MYNYITHGLKHPPSVGDLGSYYTFVCGEGQETMNNSQYSKFSSLRGVLLSRPSSEQLKIVQVVYS